MSGKFNRLLASSVAFAGTAQTLCAQNQVDVDAAAKGAAAGFGVITILYWIIAILIIVAMWKVYKKADKPGWASIIPIYNVVVLLEIARRPLWWIILFFIPFVNIIMAIIVSIDVAKGFGKDVGFGIGLAFLPFIFYPILGFGSSQYQSQEN
jgi:hypothetical protein